MGTEQLLVFYPQIFNTKTKQFLFQQSCHFSTPSFLPAIISFSCLPPADRIDASGHQLLPKKWNLPLCARRLQKTALHSHLFIPSVFFSSSSFFFNRCHALRSRKNPKRLLLALQLDYSLIVPLFPPATKNEKKRKEKSRGEGFLTSTGLPGCHWIAFCSQPVSDMMQHDVTWAYALYASSNRLRWAPVCVCVWERKSVWDATERAILQPRV